MNSNKPSTMFQQSYYSPNSFASDLSNYVDSNFGYAGNSPQREEYHTSGVYSSMFSNAFPLNLINKTKIRVDYDYTSPDRKSYDCDNTIEQSQSQFNNSFESLPNEKLPELVSDDDTPEPEQNENSNEDESNYDAAYSRVIPIATIPVNNTETQDARKFVKKP